MLLCSMLERNGYTRLTDWPLDETELPQIEAREKKNDKQIKVVLFLSVFMEREWKMSSHKNKKLLLIFVVHFCCWRWTFFCCAPQCLLNRFLYVHKPILLMLLLWLSMMSRPIKSCKEQLKIRPAHIALVQPIWYVYLCMHILHILWPVVFSPQSIWSFLIAFFFSSSHRFPSFRTFESLPHPVHNILYRKIVILYLWSIMLMYDAQRAHLKLFSATYYHSTAFVQPIKPIFDSHKINTKKMMILVKLKSQIKKWSSIHSHISFSFT